MKLRYRKSADLYIPQYFIPKEDEWVDFKVHNLPQTLKNLCRAIGNLQASSKWSEGQWHYNPEKGKEIGEMSLIFMKEIYVMAFLGAAKSTYTNETKEFEL